MLFVGFDNSSRNLGQIRRPVPTRRQPMNRIIHNRSGGRYGHQPCQNSNKNKNNNDKSSSRRTKLFLRRMGFKKKQQKSVVIVTRSKGDNITDVMQRYWTEKRPTGLVEIWRPDTAVAPSETDAVLQRLTLWIGHCKCRVRKLWTTVSSLLKAEKKASAKERRPLL